MPGEHLHPNRTHRVLLALKPLSYTMYCRRWATALTFPNVLGSPRFRYAGFIAMMYLPLSFLAVMSSFIVGWDVRAGQDRRSTCISVGHPDDTGDLADSFHQALDNFRSSGKARLALISPRGSSAVA